MIKRIIPKAYTDRPPTVDDDLLNRFTIGQEWFDATTNKEYICIDNSNSNAIWVEKGSSGGGVFIVNIVPQSTGNVANKVFSSGGMVLDSCLTDTQLVRVAILAITGSTNYLPVILVDGQPVYMNVQPDKPMHVGEIDIDLQNKTSITAVHEDGAQWTTQINYDSNPVIQSAVFTGSYAGTQTELKSGDTFNLNVVSDINIVSIELDNYGAYSAQTFNFTATQNKTITGTIANRGTTVQNLGAKVRVKKSTGSYSEWFLTESVGSVDGVNLLKLNNLYPTVTIGSHAAITYPTGQSALKDSETAIVPNQVSNHNTVSYTSGNSELSIANSSVYETNKTVTRIGGTYNVLTNNLTVTANRTANNATTTANYIIAIANTNPTITITKPTRLISGGNDGTTAQNHTITITSSQRLYEAPTLGAPVGTWQGAGFSGSWLTWTRSLQINDNITKGSYSFGSLVAKNLAGKIVTTATGTTYTIGGFVSRIINLLAFANEVNMNVEVTDYTKLTLVWSFKTLTNKRAVGTTTTPDANSWCIEALNTNPTLIRILDTAATSSSSQLSTLTIQETI